MRNELRQLIRVIRRDVIAAAITLVIMAPTVHFFGDFSWTEALGLTGVPLLMMLGVKVMIDGWFPPAEMPADDLELVDVHLDRRGRLRGYWRPRNNQHQLPPSDM